MALQGLPIALLGLFAVAIAALLVGYRYTRSRAVRQLLTSGIMFTLVSALVLVVTYIPEWVNLAPDDVSLVLFIQIAHVLWWISLARLSIRASDVLLWRGLFGGQTVPKLLKDVLGAVYYIIALFMVVAFVFEQPVTGLLATSGVVAVVLGFALQNTLSDVFSGIALNMEHPYRQGDWIRLDTGFEGEVVEINWRATHLRSREDTEIVQPNSGMATARIVNFHYPDRVYAFNVQVRIDYKVPPARVKSTLKAAALACERIKKHPGPIPRILRFDDSFVIYDMKVWVSDFAQHPDHVDELMTSIWEHMRWAGISAAFPQRDIHIYEEAERDETDSLAVSELLDRVDLFASLEMEEKNALAAKLEQRQVRPGQQIVQQGAEGSSLYVVAEGLMEVRVRFEEDGPERKVAQVGPGDFFGEMSLLTGAPRSATVITLTDSVIYKIEKMHLEPILQARPPIAESLVSLLSLRQEATKALAEGEDGDALDSQQADTTYADQMLGRIRNFFQLKH
ncbi:MAG: mechanosensitive ion channel family protein [Rhodospirillaceae bacterium]|nr:mechanosensitive ion channel family protein [Rhodospirillaceae bacterium]